MILGPFDILSIRSKISKPYKQTTNKFTKVLTQYSFKFPLKISGIDAEFRAQMSELGTRSHDSISSRSEKKIHQEDTALPLKITNSNFQ